MKQTVVRLLPLSAAALLMLSAACGPAGDTPGSGWQDDGTANTSSAKTNGTDPNGGAGETPPPGPGTVSGQDALSVHATGFTGHAGETLYAAVLDANNNRAGNANIVVPSGGDFNMTFPKALTANGNFRLVYYSDTNKNGFCNLPPADASWSVPIPAGSGTSATLNIAQNTNYAQVCEGFGQYSLTFAGSAFGGHSGQTFYIDVVDTKDNTTVGRIESQVVPSGGNTSGSWNGLLVSGHAYMLAYFADVNKDGQCTNGGQQGGGDHAWTKAVPAVSANVAATGSHNETQVTNVCANFPTGKLPQ